MNEITVGVLTVSDRCYKKETSDESGPNLVSMIKEGIIKNGKVVFAGLVPDCKEDIEKILEEWCENGVNLILTTGGTGVSERDVTPEATTAVAKKIIPGISNLILERSLKVTPLAALSRGVAGVREKSLIINLPGSKKASGECLEAVALIIPHAVHLITGRKEDIERVHASLENKTDFEILDSLTKTKSPYPPITVSEAHKIITERICMMYKEKIVGYERAQGYVLAQEVVANDFLPSCDVSTKDGYAIISYDCGRDRTLIGVSNPGTLPLNLEASPGCCVRISTGAPIPTGADAVAQVEVTALNKIENEVKIFLHKIPQKGENIRQKGSDFKMGQMLLPFKSYIDASSVGLLAAAGVTFVKVFDKPIVAVFSTGDELVNPSEPLELGKVRDSNQVTLTSLLKEENYEVLNFGIVRDNPRSLQNSLEKSFEAADVVITTGSMSMGERDYLKEILMKYFDADICFGRVLMKPGMPTSFGILKFAGKSKLWFGLPGNPASAFVAAQLFVLPALRKISGHEKIFPVCVKALTNVSIALEDRPQYLRAALTYSEETDSWFADMITNQSSSNIRSCINANSLLEIPHLIKSYNSSNNSENPQTKVTLDGKLFWKVKALLIGKHYT